MRFKVKVINLHINNAQDDGRERRTIEFQTVGAKFADGKPVLDHPDTLQALKLTQTRFSVQAIDMEEAKHIRSGEYLWFDVSKVGDPVGRDEPPARPSSEAQDSGQPGGSSLPDSTTPPPNPQP